VNQISLKLYPSLPPPKRSFFFPPDSLALFPFFLYFLHMASSVAPLDIFLLLFFFFPLFQELPRSRVPTLPLCKAKFSPQDSLLDPLIGPLRRHDYLIGTPLPTSLALPSPLSPHLFTPPLHRQDLSSPSHPPLLPFEGSLPQLLIPPAYLLC